jgi:rhomboid protease GluP
VAITATVEATATIQAQTRRQAMDWSLVLASQGIEAAIEQAEHGYELVVLAGNHEAALDAIQKYRAENRSRPWRQRILREGLVFDWASLAWVALVACFHWLGTRFDLASRGLMDSSAVAQGEWWRLFTAIWLHADIGHLATNAAIGFVLLGLAMGRFGMMPALFGAVLTGVGGNLLAGTIATQPHRSLGASGLVMGCLGILAVQSAVQWGNSPHARKTLLAGLAGGILLFVMLGLSRRSRAFWRFHQRAFRRGRLRRCGAPALKAIDPCFDGHGLHAVRHSAMVFGTQGSRSLAEMKELFQC